MPDRPGITRSLAQAMTQRLISLCGTRPSWRCTRAWLLAHFPSKSRIHWTPASQHRLKQGENVVRDRSLGETQRVCRRKVAEFNPGQGDLVANVCQEYTSGLVLSYCSLTIDGSVAPSAEMGGIYKFRAMFVGARYPVFSSPGFGFALQKIRQASFWLPSSESVDDYSQLSLRADDVAGE